MGKTLSITPPGECNKSSIRTVNPDYFVERDGVVFAGEHLLIDFHGAGNLDNAALIETALAEAAQAAGATILHIHVHEFSSGGVSGVAVLAESHISIHTWPERAYAAIDIFMCGKCDPHQAIPVLERALAPETTRISANKRGVVA